MKPTGFLLGVGFAGAFAVVAIAHSGATGIVKTRMDGMAAMGDAVKALAPVMRGQVPYDAKAVRDTANLIKAHAGAAMIDTFPVDSNAHPSMAKADIWKNWDEFQGLAMQLETLAKGMALAAGNGLMATGQAGAGSMMGMGTGNMAGGAMMGGQGQMMADMSLEALAAMPADAVFNMVGQTCSACHTRFRVEK